jgi:ubiquitin-conjugating enzyme E2 variant
MVEMQTEAEGGHGSAGPGQWMEVAGTFGFLALVLLNLVRLGSGPKRLSWWTPVAALCGLVLADFVSGVVHWMADTWGSESTPWVGPRFVRPFRIHHSDPLAMLRGDFFETNGNTALLALPLLLAALALPQGKPAGRFAAVLLVALCSFGFATNQIHKWAHMGEPPWVTRWLQRRGLILAPQHHEVHHTAPFATHYCTTTGWCNGLLASTGFFPALERWIASLTGLTPRAYEPARSVGAAPSPPARTPRPWAGPTLSTRSLGPATESTRLTCT